MNLKNYKKISKMCLNKIAYDDKRKAISAAIKSTLRNQIEFHVYLCPNCTMWHITKSPKTTITEPKCPVFKGKTQYNTEEAAIKAKPNLGRFLCNNCGKWHITTAIKKPEQWR
jgi:predicted RNA-binding Zn-ribbon protein involved in translation (DUF1610 family)